MCCLLFVVGSSLCVARRSLFVVMWGCVSLLVVCWLLVFGLLASCCLWFVGCCLLVVVRCCSMLTVSCVMLVVCCRLLFVVVVCCALCVV